MRANKYIDAFKHRAKYPDTIKDVYSDVEVAISQGHVCIRLEAAVGTIDLDETRAVLLARRLVDRAEPLLAVPYRSVSETITQKDLFVGGTDGEVWIVFEPNSVLMMSPDTAAWLSIKLLSTVRKMKEATL